VVNLKIIIAIIIGIGVFGIIIGGAIEFNSEKEREGVPWREATGPFQIEKYEYYLGEKIFLNVNDIPTGVSGEIIFFRPAPDGNSTNTKVEGISADLISKKAKYITIKFDSENKQNFHRYFEPKFSEWNGVCSRDQLVGEWITVFNGTEYKNINFIILNQTTPGDKRTFEPIC